MIRDHEMLMKFSIFWAPLKIFLLLYIPNVIIKRKKPLEGTESLQCSISLQWKAENKKKLKKGEQKDPFWCNSSLF